MKKFKIHLSVECVGTAELEAASEKQAMEKMKQIVQNGQLDVGMLKPLFFKGAVDKDSMRFESLI